MTTTASPPPETGTWDPRWVIAAVLALIAIRLAVAGLVPLGPDETYYRLWSQFPVASYYDHPPMVAWWIAASTAFFGDSALGVRAISVLSAIPTTIAVYLTGSVLFGKAISERAALWVNATLLIGVGGILATPDAPAVMFWALTILAVALVLRTRQGAWWLAAGLFAGLGILSKLTDLFLGAGVVLAILAVRDLRRWLLSPWLWAGGLVALVVVTPMLAWNAGHAWITFTKQLGRVGAGTFDPLKLPEFIATQFALLNPLLAIFAGLGVAVWIGRRATDGRAAFGILLWSVLPLVAYMTVHSFHDQVQGHWLAPIFPTLALVAAAAAETAPERWAALRRLVFPVGAVLSVAGLVLAATPGLPVQLDAGQVIRGWDRFAAEADGLRRSSGAAWIATTYYGLDGEVAYHLRDKGVPVVGVAERARFAFAPPPDAGLLAKPVLIVSEQGAGFFGRCFLNVAPLGQIERRSGEIVLETFNVYTAARANATAFDPGCDK